MIGALADELIEIRFAVDPLWPSLLGLSADHGKLPDPTAAGEQRTRLALADVIARAEAVDRTSLSTVDSVTRDVIVQQAKSMLDVLDSRLPDYTVSDAFSAPVQRLLLLMPSLVLSDEEKSRGFLTRLAAIPSYVDAVIERQRAALDEGFAPAGFLVDMGADFFERYLGSPETDPLLVESDLDGFASERDRLLAEVVHPAFARYKDFLALEMKPRAKPDSQPGLCWKPGGAEKYAKLIRVHTTVSTSAEELHELGLSVLAGLAAEYRELGERVFGLDDLAEIFERLRTDPALRWNSCDELLESARAAISRAETVAPRWFNSVPPTKCLVDAIPAAQADGGTMGYYLERALDGSREGTYFANTFDAHERPRHVSEAIAFHEAVPGHHFQIELAQELTELPLLRRMAEVNSYSEGWGLYAERLADEMGLYSGDVAKFGMLLQDSLRAGRLVVDTGMHALGWSRAQAVDFLRDHTPMTPLEIEAEVDRYAGWPAQALSYMVGRLEIQRMRTEAEKALGDRFDIKAFHDVVLGSGVLPLPVLAKLVEDWVAAQ
ncbi:Uncharacterized conserved protein, DUF885 familyt [Amycolatopsis xylanica]|uniref:Uncharacterized conserved protein, DUF885 familyt n=2 Tax=Amycolatopsis xylanica TaxID=589385 RepID=A0A1H3G872_9PSEU|nr:Uncharacterized conserved protein, DUF885 familyt [Amycolatopsis xylanica]